MGGNTASKQGTIQRQKKRPLPNLAGPFSELQPLQLYDVDDEMTELGCGSYAVVKKITRRGEKFAAKQLHASLFNAATPEEKTLMLSQFARECRLLQRAAHPNVVKFVGLHMDQREDKTLPLPYLVMEYMQTTLSGYLEKSGKPDSATALRILSDVALGLQFLHKHIPAIIHRDLSANNVLLSSKLQAKISDLGMAKIIDQGGKRSKKTQTKAPGTPCYMPPEALRDKPTYDTSIDTFSFGVLMVHVLSGQWPLPVHGTMLDPKNTNQLIALTEFQCRMKYVNEVGLDHPLMPLIERCLHNNSANRPNAPDIAETVMAVMAAEINPKPHVAIKKFESKTSYELSSQVGERFLVYGDALDHGGSLVKVASRSSRQVGYIPKEIIYKLDNLYISTKPHRAQRKEELDIFGREFMFILDREGIWFYVEVLRSGKRGLVPTKSIVKFKPMDQTDWYFPHLTNDDARALLSRPLNEEGVFLVGEDTYSDNKVLFVKHKGSIVEYKISQTSQGSFSVDTTDDTILYQSIFNSMEELLLFYSSKKEDVLCTKLDKPCIYTSEWEIKTDEIALVTLRKSLGQTEVWRGFCGKHAVQCKKLKSLTQEKENEEIQVLKRLDHPNIVKFHGIVVEKVSITIITEGLEWNTIKEHYTERKISNLPNNISISILGQVLNGLAHLQANNVVHLSFGAKNVLFTEMPNLHCIITNFNQAKRIDVSNKIAKIEMQEMRWLPPEAFEGKFLHKNCDVWSFGIFIHELFTGCDIPYSGMSNSEVAAKVKVGYIVDRPDSCPEQVHAIARECMNISPDKRPSFESLQPRMRQLTVTLTMDGRPIPAPRRKVVQSGRPVPKPRRNKPVSTDQEKKGQVQANYENRDFPPEKQPVAQSESGPPLPVAPRTKSLVPLIPTSVPPLPRKSPKSLNSEYQIKRKELKLVSKVRNHLEDEVWEGVWKGNTPVLVTVQQKEVPEHIEILKKLKNENVVKLIGLCMQEPPMYLVTEIMKPGSLLTFLRGNKGALEDEILLDLAVDIAKGMAYLHSHFVIHRDLRADTILLDENNTCKIAHFNYIKRVDEDTHTFTAVGNERIAVKWAAPEAIANGVFSTRSDVWSFGIILYEIVTFGTMPYPGMKNADTVRKVAEGYRMEQPDSTYCPDEVYQIMLKCWDQKPDCRPSSIILPQTLRDLTQQQEDFNDDIEEEFEGYIDITEFIEEVAKDWSIAYSDLTFLAQEGLGHIWKGKFKHDTSVAIKSIDIQSMEGEIKQRVEVMKELKHVNILELCGVCTTEKVVYVVTEFMEHGNLHNYLQWNSHSLTTPNLVSISWQVSKGMAYLEENGIIHGNLSAVKVFVGVGEPDKLLCKVSGMFGTEDDKTSVGFNVRIPLRWMAPETAVENVYQLESDVWAFGVVLYEIMTCGQQPFPGIREDEVLDQVIRGYRMLCPVDCKEDIYRLMLECWNEDPSRRPSFETIATKLSDVETYEDHIIDKKNYDDLPLEDNKSNQSTDVKIEVDLQLKVAESATGDIWRGIWKGIDVAVKYPKLETVKETLESFELMKSLVNPNIIRILGILSKNQSAYVVMDFMCRGNLQDYIAWEGSFLTLEKQIEIAIQCAKGMLYLETQRIIHGNLTGRNVLVGYNMECKITGIQGKGVKNEDHRKFYKWMAVESMLYNKFSTKSDTWSFGILLYEIMTHGEEPYPKWNGSEAKVKIQEGYRMTCPSDCPKEVYTLMMRCWNAKPSQRPPFSEIERKLEDVIAYDSIPVQEDWPWNIRPQDLSRKSKMADLESGEVWSGVFRGTNEVAILCPAPYSLSAEISVAELMKSLKHPHILTIFGICSVSNDTVWICTEVMSNGNLKNYIQREKSALSVQQLVNFSTQCARGMLYLEEMGIIHGNLTARQILVGEDLTCKITGISGGGAESEDPYEGNITITYFLPIKWRAPETIRYNDMTGASDVWSFGIVLYEIMSYGKDPYAGMSNQTASEEIEKGHCMECPPNSPRPFGNLITDCWARKPEMRPKFDNITLRLTNLFKFMSECDIGDQIVVSQSSLEIKQSDLVFEEKITSGKSGDIWKGILKETKQVAVQVVVEKDEEWIQSMLKLNHPNILGIEAVCYTQLEALIVTELMENDNLVKFLRGGGRSLKLQQLMHIAVQISQGMLYLKNQQVVHRDLCARNVLVGDKMACKITGILGDWADMVDDPYYEGRVYTPPVKWAAPEAALYGIFTYQSDIWSFGIVLYEIVTYGRFPYPGMTRYEVISKIQEGYRMPYPNNCHPTVYEIMRKCWEEQPEGRYTTENLNKGLRNFHQSLFNAKNEWEVEENDVRAEQRIGESGIGEEFWRGKFCQKSVAIKYHSPKVQSLKDFVHETDVLQTLSHQNVIQFHGLCLKGKAIFMLLEPVKSCNLLEHVRTAHFSLSHGDVLEMAFDIVTGMAYLHKQGIVHRNLTASNIVIGNNGKCKISNFQQALIRKQGVSLSRKSTAGKVRWMAVEVLSNSQYSTMSDVWSYGILLYELATQGQTPYPSLTDGLVCHKVPSGYCMSAPPGCPSGLYNIMTKCWVEVPRQRPSSDILQGSIEKLLTQNKKWETSEDQVVKKKSLGQEKYVEFWTCVWKKTEVIVKYHKPGTCSREIFLWEAEVMKTVESPYIVKLLAVCTHTPRSFIVFEAMDETLYAVLRRQMLTKLADILAITIQVVKGMLYLQEQRVIHRSLMARNILVKDKTTCKVCNFSEAIIGGRELTEAQKVTKLPIRWIPPESPSSNYTYFSLKTDVWSFGILLHEIFTHGVLPYSDVKDSNTVLKKLNMGYRMPCPETCPQSVYKMMRECWDKEPEKRPTFHEIHNKLEKIQSDLNWEIELTEISVVKKIDDTGRFGEVWEGQYKDIPVAVKYHKPYDQTNISEEFLWEAELLKTLNHPYVIKLIGLNSSVENVFIVLAYMNHGPLNSYLKSFGRSQTLKSLLMMGTQVADGMAYLQTQKIIHRDLGARSILVGDNNVCVVSDFSEAMCMARNDNPERQGRKLPAKWLPPEAVFDNVFDMHTDIWSYGILLYEIVTFGRVPYKGISPDEALTEIQKGYRMPMPSGCPVEIHSIMNECWREKPSTRPTFETVHLQMQRITKSCKNTPVARSRTLTAYDIPTERRRSWTESHDPWEIDRYLVTLDAKHEEGRFGEVWKGYLRGIELVAVKRPKLDRTTALEFLHESEIMKLIDHSNVVSLKGVCTKGESIYIITEFMTKGNLVKYLRSPAGRRTAQSQLLKWAIQISNGMMHLEKCRIIHRDVAARNILLGEQLVCKISDFGLAQKVSGDTYKESSRTQFPLKWMAPESIRQRIFSVKSDVWAFGILLYEMVTHGALPYPGVQNRDVAELVKAGYRMPRPRGCPKGLHEIMDNCWKETPEERPNFSTINTSLNSLLKHE